MKGMADLLLYATQVLNVPNYAKAGCHLIKTGLNQASQSGKWRFGTLDGKHSFGLMLGLGGVGAVMLRYYDPSKVPPLGLLTYSSSS